MEKKIKLILLFLLTTFVLYFFLFEIDNGEKLVERAENLILSTSTSTKEEFSDPKPEPNNLPVHQLETSAWIPYWDESRGFKTFLNNSDKIDSVSPVWFYANANASLSQRRSNDIISTYVEQVHEKQGLIIPTITNASAQELSNIINNTDLLNTHIQEIVKKVETLNFDGIDIDYENLNNKDQESFTNFIYKLGEELHKKKKLLTIAVLPKTDNIIYQFSSSRQAQDWEEIGKNVDELRIMGYDWSHNSTTGSGPISPLYWLEEVLQYAIKKVPKEKIVLGLPLYGYYWKANSVEALTWEQAEKLKNDENYQWDDVSHENHLMIGTNNAWYHDSRSINERRELAKEFKLKGVVYWRLGGEDPNLWK